MKTIALRFSDNYAPDEGMIELHNQHIKKDGFVWYGKFGSRISKDLILSQLKTEKPRFLLIKSGSVERYWAYFEDFIQDTIPPLENIPNYYRDKAKEIKCWFKIVKFERAKSDVLSKCFVLSSGDCLSVASKHSMNPYFRIDYRGDFND